MKAIELFSGIGGFRLACDANDITTVFANDIKENACAVYKDRFGQDVLREGDIKEFIEDIPDHDLLTGGFPCQSFSSAGKKEGIRDPRGTLFEDIVKILERKAPQYFVLENVKRLLSMEDGEHFATILDRLASLNYRIEWRVLNAMHFGLPQNRQRVFITGVKLDEDEEVRIRLLSQAEIDGLPRNAISHMQSFSDWQLISTHGKRFPNWGISYNNRFIGFNQDDFSEKLPMVNLKTILEDAVGKEFDFTESTIGRLAQGTVLKKFVQGVEILSNEAGGARMGYTIFGVNGVAPTLTASTSRHYERYKIGDTYRRLTNVEYARIQGFPDDHCNRSSVYNQYELIGNAVPPQMAAWVIRQLRCSGISVAQTARVTAAVKSKKSVQRDIFEYGE